jgi:hypothetical protein
MFTAARTIWTIAEQNVLRRIETIHADEVSTTAAIDDNATWSSAGIIAVSGIAQDDCGF